MAKNQHYTQLFKALGFLEKHEEQTQWGQTIHGTLGGKDTDLSRCTCLELACGILGTWASRQ